MAAGFLKYDGGYFEYPTANSVKNEGDKYAVYDSFGNPIGVHQKDDIAEFTTSTDLMNAMKAKSEKDK